LDKCSPSPLQKSPTHSVGESMPLTPPPLQKTPTRSVGGSMPPAPFQPSTSKSNLEVVAFLCKLSRSRVLTVLQSFRDGLSVKQFLELDDDHFCSPSARTAVHSLAARIDKARFGNRTSSLEFQVSCGGGESSDDLDEEEVSADDEIDHGCLAVIRFPPLEAGASGATMLDKCSPSPLQKTPTRSVGNSTPSALFLTSGAPQLQATPPPRARDAEARSTGKHTSGSPMAPTRYCRTEGSPSHAPNTGGNSRKRLAAAPSDELPPRMLHLGTPSRVPGGQQS